MPVRKFRDVAEMEGNTWHEPGSPELFRAIRNTWAFATRTLQPYFPPGVYKHRSLEDAQKLCEDWAKANFAAYRKRLAEKSS
jgi:hypothetical protein